MPQCILSSPSPPLQPSPHAPPCPQGPGKSLRALPLPSAAAFRDHDDRSRPPADAPIPLLVTIPPWTLSNFLFLSLPNHVIPPLPPSLTTSPSSLSVWPSGPFPSPGWQEPSPPSPPTPTPCPSSAIQRRFPEKPPTPSASSAQTSPPPPCHSTGLRPLPFPPTLAPPSSTRRSSPLFIQRDPHGHIPPAYGACGPSLDCRYHSEGPGATHQSSLSTDRLLSIHHAGRDHLHPPGPRPNPEPAQTPDPPDPP